MNFNQFRTNLHYIENETGLTPEQAKDVLVVVELINKFQDLKFGKATA